jgi:hypothetical protein
MENPAIAGTTKVAIPRLSRPGSGERPGELGDDGQRARVKRAVSAWYICCAWRSLDANLRSASAAESGVSRPLPGNVRSH